MKKPLEMLTASKLEELAAFLSEEVERLARAGAAFALVAANTPHLVFDAIARQSHISLISIVEATAEAAKASTASTWMSWCRESFCRKRAIA